MLFILFHCAMLVCGYVDAQIIVARVLYDVNYCLLTELGDLSFLLQFVCASYEIVVYMCFVLCHAIFTEVFSKYLFDLCGDYNRHAN